MHEIQCHIGGSSFLSSKMTAGVVEVEIIGYDKLSAALHSAPPMNGKETAEEIAVCTVNEQSEHTGNLAYFT